MTAAAPRNRALLRHLGSRPQFFHVIADSNNRSMLAERFGLDSIASLTADLELWREDGGVELAGQFNADAVQRCAISQEPVPAHVKGEIRLRFERPMADAPSEVELESDMLETLPLEGDEIDLVETVAQSFYLALDPYPRADAETIQQYRRYLLSEQEAAQLQEESRKQSSPFASLRSTGCNDDSIN